MAEFSPKVEERVRAATVQIFTTIDGKRFGGSGFLISEDGHIATNFHVIDKATEVVVLCGSGTTVYKRAARVLVSSRDQDLAIIKVNPLPAKIQPLELGVGKLHRSQEVMALGFPVILDFLYASNSGGPLQSTADEMTVTTADSEAYEATSSTGTVVKQMPRSSDSGGTFQAIAHSAMISGGHSGGPLIDHNGRVVGVNAQVTTNDVGIYAFAVRADQLEALAKLNGIPVKTSVDAAGPPRTPLRSWQIALLVALAVFAVLLFLLMLRRPRAVMVDAVSRVIPRRSSVVTPRHAPPPQRTDAVPGPDIPSINGYVPQSVQAEPTARWQPPQPQQQQRRTSAMRLRGRDRQGRSYDLSFTEDDFRRRGGRLVLGRNRELAQLHLPEDSVSRQHATLTYDAGNVMVEDRNSGNGTSVNGRELRVGTAPVALRSGDRLSLGEVDLIFEFVP